MADQYVPALRQRFLEDMRIKGLLPKTQTTYLRTMRGFTWFLGHSPNTARAVSSKSAKPSSDTSAPAPFGPPASVLARRTDLIISACLGVYQN
jgi:hypothetical protein